MIVVYVHIYTSIWIGAMLNPKIIDMARERIIAPSKIDSTFHAKDRFELQARWIFRGQWIMRAMALPESLLEDSELRSRIYGFCLAY